MANKVFIRGEYAKSITLTKNVHAFLSVRIAAEHRLTDEETAELVNKAQSGDFAAQSAVVNDNLGLVLSIARSFQFLTYATPFDLGDLISEGTIGLIQAIPNYKADEGNFSNIACAYIRRQIVRFAAEKMRLVHRPYNKQDAPIGNGSLDEPLGGEDGDGDTRADMLSGDTNRNNHSDLDSLSVDISRTLGCLNAKERYCIIHHFGMGCEDQSLSTLANHFGQTDERIRQIIRDAISKMGIAKKLLAAYL